jgi:RNA polymerase sigma-70 factor (ECF subfamily)
MVTDVQGDEVARLRAGEAQAFRSLVERLQQPVIGYLHRLVGESEVARDLAQDTFLQVYKEISKVSGPLALDPWIYRIATNYGLRYLNRRRLRQFISFSFQTENTHTSIAEEYTIGTNTLGHDDFAFLSQMSPSIEEQIETRVLVQQAIDQLGHKDAVCVVLHYGSGFTYEEIANIVDSSPEAVRKRVSRGVVKFRAIYEQERQSDPVPRTPREVRKRTRDSMMR